MGRVATEMMKKLGAVEMTSRLYAIVYGFINIWKEPWQAGLMKHQEAYEVGTTTGDLEFAFTSIWQYINTAIIGCAEPLERMSQDAQLYAKRAFQCNQVFYWQGFACLHQLTLDLMGIKQNAFGQFCNGMSEETCFQESRQHKEVSFCQAVCRKRKLVAFFTGRMDTAVKMYELLQAEFPMGPTGRLSSVLVSEFIDGLIGFFFARKRREDEEKWTKVGLDVIKSFRKWVTYSQWNFLNKLHLLEAEYYFLRGDDERAVVSYMSSIVAAKEHRFIHEEGLAEEKFATYFLNKSMHDDAINHFHNAKKCYEAWGAHALVRRIDDAIAMLVPVCKG